MGSDLKACNFTAVIGALERDMTRIFRFQPILDPDRGSALCITAAARPSCKPNQWVLTAQLSILTFCAGASARKQAGHISV